MKKLFTTFLLVSAIYLFGQAPQSINYQAVIRDASGAVISNQTVSLKLEITSAAGNYVEIRNVVTNNLGLVNLALGLFPASGSVDFDEIIWGGNSLTTYLDPSGGASNWQSIGTIDLHSVPFALVAEKATFADSVSFLGIANQISFVLNGDSLIIPGIDTLVIPFSQYSLTEAQVDSMVANNGFLLVEGDSSNTNEIQFISRSNDTIYLTSGGYVVLPTDLDVDPTNEIQDLSITSNILTITGKTNPNSIDLSGYLDNTVLSEAQVDAYANNNGYLTTEVDGSITNEIQDLSISSNILTITGKTNPTSIDLSGYLDNTVLSEAQVDAYANNNGYLTAEIDGSITNEIQDLDSVLSVGNDANGIGIIDLGNVYIGTNTGATSAALDVTSTTQGFLPPRMTQVQRDAIASPTQGLIVWCTDCGTNGLLSGFDGIGWANLELSNSSGTVPTVSTFPISTFGFSSATFSGSVLNNGGKPILAKGLCYSTAPNPNISDFVTTIDTGMGSFNYSVQNLSQGTTYYVRAFAQNANGTAYGTQEVFTTKETLAVGDTFGGGIVGYILQPGDFGFVSGEQHGIIVCNTDFLSVPTGYGWCGQTATGGYPTSNLNVLSFDSTKCTRRILGGAHNTNLILQSCPNIINPSIVRMVDGWSYNGYSDWLVPTLDDLYAIKTNQTIINQSLATGYKLQSGGQDYWSSTTFGNSNVFVVEFGASYTGNSYISTTNNGYTRPVRYF